MLLLCSIGRNNSVHNKVVFLLCTLLAACLLAGQAQGQTYRDSLIQYRQQYVQDMYKVIKEDTANISFYEADERYRIVADIILLKDRKPFPMTTSSGKTKDAVTYAILHFKAGRKECRLYVYQLLAQKNKEPEHLFLPFTDLTSGKTSYAGGRYIDLSLSEIKEGKILLDFNKAYNPYCAFTTGYNCPIPPAENRLPVAIKAGQKYSTVKSKFHPVR